MASVDGAAVRRRQVLGVDDVLDADRQAAKQRPIGARIDAPRLLDGVGRQRLPRLHQRLAFRDPGETISHQRFGGELAQVQPRDGVRHAQFVRRGHASHHFRAMRRYASTACSILATEHHSSVWWQSAISPGPNTTVGMPP